MEFRSATAAAALVIGALTVATGSANAEPTPQEHITYSTKLVDKAVVTTLEGGTFALSRALDSQLEAGGGERLVEKDGVLLAPDGTPADPAAVVDVVDVKDGEGNILLTLPLDFRLGPIAIPVKSEVDKDATVLSLTPDKPAGVDLTQPLAVKPVASQLENQRALNDFTTQFGLATSIGGFVGTAIGATIGCIATLVAGCIPGLTTGATAGGIIGTIAVGGPTLIASGIDLLTTMNAADGTTKWADKPKVTTQAPQPEQPK
ncbi:hypothetical protein [Nocardia crassostreae]|uniref:hypothetical protein n=1 Tax=Nocardia crassostreae TaxID=53428 RepID=UPI000829ECDE|nr:hypothetical protein [Nocardia crassostreae]